MGAEYLTEKLQKWNPNFRCSWVALIGLLTTQPRGPFLASPGNVLSSQSHFKVLICF